MKYAIGDCLSFHAGDNGYLAGIVCHIMNGSYYLALADYRQLHAPPAAAFNSLNIFSTKWNTEDSSPFFTLDIIVLDPAEADDATTITKVSHIAVAGLLPLGDLTPLGYSPEALYDAYKNAMAFRRNESATTDLFGVQQKTFSVFSEILAGIAVPNPLATIKLYRGRNGKVHYWQCYGSPGTPPGLITHEGILGEQGVVSEIMDKTLDELTAIYRQGIEEKRAEGYAEWPDPASMILQLASSDEWGAMEDLDFRNEIWDYLDQVLFWSANGAVRGADIGSGTLNLFFEAVSPGLAVQTIVQALAGKGVERPFLVARENSWPQLADEETEPVTVLYPEGFAGRFSY